MHKYYFNLLATVLTGLLSSTLLSLSSYLPGSTNVTPFRPQGPADFLESCPHATPEQQRLFNQAFRAQRTGDTNLASQLYAELAQTCPHNPVIEFNRSLL